jgi:hypothetical protein
MSSEDTFAQKQRRAAEKLRQQEEKRKQGNIFDASTMQWFDPVSGRPVSKAKWRDLAGTKNEDLLYGAWYSTPLSVRRASGERGGQKGDLVGGLQQNVGASYMHGIRGDATKQNVSYTRKLLSQMYPDANDDQLDLAAAKAFRDRLSDRGTGWIETSDPNDIAASIGRYMPGGLGEHQQRIVDAYDPYFSDRRKNIKKQRNAADDASGNGFGSFAGILAGGLGTLVGGPILGGALGTLVSTGDVKKAALGGLGGYLGGQFGGMISDKIPSLPSFAANKLGDIGADFLTDAVAGKPDRPDMPRRASSFQPQFASQLGGLAQYMQPPNEQPTGYNVGYMGNPYGNPFGGGYYNV